MIPSTETLEDFLTILPAVLYEYSQQQDGSGQIRYLSPNSLEILGYPAERFLDKDLTSFLAITHENDRERLAREDKETVNDPFFTSEVRIVLPSTEIRWVRFRSKPSAKSATGEVRWVGCIVDITALKKAQEEIKVLRGILPICSFCSKIRDDKGYWTQVDKYLLEHTEAEISHSICPECMEKQYPDL